MVMSLYKKLPIVKNYILPGLLAMSLLLCSCSNSTDYTQYVDPFIGTGGHGHTYPGAQVPFGMVQLSPDTRNDGSWDGCGGYHYSDSSIIGFSHTHLSGTGVSDYGDILLMPITGAVNLLPGTRDNPKSGYRSLFKHESEKAEPGYYSVFLDDYKVKVELTAGLRVGYHRYTFQKDGPVNLLLDLIHRDPVSYAEINFVGDHCIEGVRRSKYWAGDQQLFFVIELSKPFEKTTIYDNHKGVGSKVQAEGKMLQSVALFNMKKGDKLEARVAISAVSIEGARNNLSSESNDMTFDKARRLANREWNNSLGKIQVEGGTLKQKRIFYSSLYHSLLTPNVSQDVDGKYRGMDGEVHIADDFTNYTVFSLWDTFRGLHPLLTILEPQRTNDFVKSLVRKSEEFGEFPMWELASNDTRCMIGYHAVSVIADAYAKGIRDYDLEAAYTQMKRSAMVDKRGLKAYRTFGYVPSNKSSQGVSKTLEYAYDDWCIAQIAKAIGKQEDYHYFMNRSTNYRNIYDASVGFMRGRDDNHQWVSNFDPTAVGYNYTEGNSFQYSLFVPHDMEGLIGLLGGKDSLNNWLDRLFTTSMVHELGDDSDVSGLIGQYAHGNEPSHNMAYLYNYAGKPWKTQKTVRAIMKQLYGDTPDGLCGNEDCGQMSAWYVLSAMGFYPVCPGEDLYAIGSPIFSKVTIDMGKGKKFVIEAPDTSDDHLFIQSATLNGKSINSCFISHNSMVSGGTLTLDMGAMPDYNWGIDTLQGAKRYRASSMAYLTETSDYFLDHFTVDMNCDDPNAAIYYTLDGTTPTRESIRYEKPFVISSSTCVKMRSYSPGCEEGYVVSRNIRKVNSEALYKGQCLPGLTCSYYEGIYRSVYDFEDDSPVMTGIVTKPTLEVCKRREWIGLDFTGLIDIPRDGKYSFILSANDGCQLVIDGQEQFESDGRKSVAFTQESTINLAEGYHDIQIRFFQCSDMIDLSFSWRSPGLDLQEVPSSVFFHKTK